MAAHGFQVPGRFFYLLTLTAPSHKVHCLRPGCDSSICGHQKCRCTPEGGVELGVWNREASKCWNRFLVGLERTYGCRPAYFRGVEVQDGKRRADGIGRRALHFHVLLRSDVALVLKDVKDLAITNGFGHELKLDVLAPGSRAAAHYVAKYVTKSCDERDDVPWLVDEDQVDDEGELTGETVQVQRPATFRTWSQSQSWGTTMAAVLVDIRRRWERVELLRLGDDWQASTDAPVADTS